MFLNDYEKIRLVGKGAFASVYKVRHAELGYIRALKVCNNLIEDKNDKAWKTFLDECKVLLNIGNGSHPNVIRIYQPRLLENHAVVEMDYVEGETLQDYIKERKFIPMDEFYRFAEQIVGAVAYCHYDIYKFLMNPKEDELSVDPDDGRKYLVSPEQEAALVKKYGVVHNDLHSGNIIRRDYDGLYVLLDFGLAIQNSHCVKSSSRFDGAIEYCAPEKLEHGDISTQSDVYAMGVLLFEMLTGQPPFPLKSEEMSPEAARTKIYQQQINEQPPSIYELRKAAFEKTHPGETYRQDFPDRLAEIIMKCLSKNPADRYANAKELFDALNPLFVSNQNTSDAVKVLNGEIGRLYEENARLKKELTDNSKRMAGTRDLNNQVQSLVNENQRLRDEMSDMRNRSGYGTDYGPEKKEPNYLVPVLLVVIIILILGFGAYLFFSNFNQPEETVTDTSYMQNVMPAEPLQEIQPVQELPVENPEPVVVEPIQEVPVDTPRVSTPTPAPQPAPAPTPPSDPNPQPEELFNL